MTRAELIALLAELQRQDQNNGDIESIHADADDALLKYIDDPEVTERYNSLDKWYA